MDYLDMLDAIQAVRHQALSRESVSACAEAMRKPLTVEPLYRDTLTRGTLAVPEWISMVYAVKNGTVMGYVQEWRTATGMTYYTVRLPRAPERADLSKAQTLEK